VVDAILDLADPTASRPREEAVDEAAEVPVPSSAD
jgi:hypothetical protein